MKLRVQALGAGESQGARAPREYQRPHPGGELKDSWRRLSSPAQSGCSGEEPAIVAPDIHKSLTLLSPRSRTWQWPLAG